MIDMKNAEQDMARGAASTDQAINSAGRTLSHALDGVAPVLHQTAERLTDMAQQGMDAMRNENLKRMQGLAGASGGENATGSALKSSGPSSSYAGRLVGRIKPNISYPGDVAGNPRAEVEVKVSPDGTILSRRIVQPSGNKAWDDAVLRAIDKTEIFPKDSDGRVPPVIVLGFRPLD